MTLTRIAPPPCPRRSEPDRSDERREKARQGLAFAAKRVALAEVVLNGGFPEEMVRPLREALGWGLSSLLALYRDRDPSADLPASRTIHAELVEPKHLPDDLALRLARVRELTEPAERRRNTHPALDRYRPHAVGRCASA